MNIYNTLYFLEYTRDPTECTVDNYKDWYLNLSKNKYNYKHRGFDLYCMVSQSYYKCYKQYNQFHRLIGPSIIKINNEKSYYIKDNHCQTIKY